MDSVTLRLRSGQALRLRSGRTLAAVLVAIALLGSSVACREEAGDARAQLYHCPMHPEVVRDRPGDCPICSMTLVPLPEGDATSPATPAAAPGPADPSQAGNAPATEPATGAAVPGRSTVTLSPEKRQLLGVRSEPVRLTDLRRRIRTAGRVAIDESRVSDVHAKIVGFVEKLHVSFTGQLVAKGQPLLALYSPELLATQEEYLLALRAKRELEASDVEGVAAGGANLLAAARQRLLRWDVSPQDIAEIERTGKPRRTLELRAETGGFVMEKMVVLGMRITPEDVLFRLADLSSVWVLADVYEHEMAHVAVGTEATLEASSRPGEGWRAPVTYVSPVVDPATRTVKLRIDVPNDAQVLKPEMLVDVSLETGQAQGLAVPEDAVIDAGERRLVFVDLGDGRLEPREVRLGGRVAGAYEVLSGLQEGERVVTAANFLLDSESSLRSAFRAAAEAPSPSGETP